MELSDGKVLTETEEREFRRRMEIVSSTVWAVQQLLERREILVDQIRALDSGKTVGAVVGLSVLGGLFYWFGGPDGVAWIRTLAILAWIWAGSTYVQTLLEVAPLRRKRDEVEWRLWDLRLRWVTNGGQEYDVARLEKMHQPYYGINLDTEEYRAWWREVREQMIKIAAPGAL